MPGSGSARDALLKSVEAGDCEAVGASFRAVDWVEEDEEDWARMPLCLAASRGHSEMVSLLLESGADFERADAKGWTALHLAAWKGHAEVASLLLESGVDVNVEGDVGATPLLLAAQHGHLGLVRLLLERGAGVDAAKEDGLTTLMLSAHRGHAAVVRVLLAMGAEVEAKGRDGLTALMLAAHKGHADVVSELLHRGAKLDVVSPARWTALHFAAIEGHADVVELLLGGGADATGRDQWGATPLMLASRQGRGAVASALLLHMAGQGIDQRDAFGYTALCWACCRGATEVANALLLAGADHTIADNQGLTPKEAAVGEDHQECAALIDRWEGELERCYLLHRARYICDQHSTFQFVLSAFPLPACLKDRLPSLPRLDIVGFGLADGEEAARDTHHVHVGDDQEVSAEEERGATLKYVMQGLPAELYVELMEGFCKRQA